MGEAMKHVMIDIETMAVGVDAAVISIGLAEFDPSTNSILEKIELRNTFGAQRGCGRKFDPETVEWWMQQEKAAQETLFVEPRFEEGHEMAQAMQDWLLALTPNGWAGQDKVALWAKPPSFDIGILRDYFSSVSVQWWGRRRNEFCVRTTLMTAKANGWTDILKMERAGVKHGALNDAIHQANQVMAVMERLKR